MERDEEVTVSFLKKLFPPPSRLPEVPKLSSPLRKTVCDELRQQNCPLDADADDKYRSRTDVAFWVYRKLSRDLVKGLVEGRIRECGGRKLSKRMLHRAAVGLVVFLEQRVTPMVRRTEGRMPEKWPDVAEKLAADRGVLDWYGVRAGLLREASRTPEKTLRGHINVGLDCLADAMKEAVVRHMADAMGQPKRAPTLYQEAFAEYQHTMREFLEKVPGQSKKLGEVFVPPYLTSMSRSKGKDRFSESEEDRGKESPEKYKQRFTGNILKDLDSNLWIVGAPGSGKSTFLRHMGLASPLDTAVVWIHPKQAAEIHRGSTVDEVMAGSIRTLRRKGVQVSEEAALALRASRSKLFLVDLGAEWVSPEVLKRLQANGRVVVAAGYRLPVALEESGVASGERKWREFSIQEWPPHKLRRLTRAYGDRTSRDMGKLLEIAGIPHYPLWIVLAIQAEQKNWSSGTDLVREFVENRAGGDERNEEYLKTLRHLAWLKQIGSDEVPTRARATVPWAQERGLLVGGGEEEIEFPHDLILHFLAADHLARKASNDPSSVGEAMEAVFGTAGWSDVVRIAVEILISRGKWNLVERVLLGMDRLVSSSWFSMGWIEGATPVGVAWRAAKKALEDRNQKPEVEMKAVEEVYARALTSLKKLLSLALEISDYEFTDAVSVAIAALDPLPPEEAEYFAGMVRDNRLRFGRTSPLSSIPTVTNVIKEKKLRGCSPGPMWGDESCTGLLHWLAERKALSVSEVLDMCKKGVRWQDILLALASIGSKEAARLIGAIWPASGRIGDERVDLEKVLEHWAGDPWNMLEMLDRMMKKRNLWQVYIRSLMRATKGEALFELPLDELDSAGLPVLFYDSMSGVAPELEIVEGLVRILKRCAGRKFTLEDPRTWTTSAVHEMLLEPHWWLARVGINALLDLLRRENILMERYPVEIAYILRRHLPDERISLLGRNLLEGHPDEYDLAAALYLLDRASEKEVREWMRHDNLEVVAGAVFLADRMGMHDQILELMEERSSDLFGADDWVLGSASGGLQNHLWGKYLLRKALQEVLPHLRPERVAAIMANALTELVERKSDSCRHTLHYKDHDWDAIDLMLRVLRVPPGLLDENLEKLRNLEGMCSVTALCHAGTLGSIEHVIQWYLQTKDQEILEAIRSEVKNPAALPVLIKYMVESPDAELRWGCARAVENIVVDGYAREIPPAVWKAILQCQDDPDRLTSEVCSRVLISTSLRKLLPHLNAKNLQEALCWYLSEESSGNRVNALDLWYYARKAGLDVRCSEDVLFDLMEDTNPQVRKAAMELLEVYPLLEALQRSREMLKYEADEGVRNAIAGALAYLGYEEDFDLLLGLALNPHSSYDETFWARLALVRHPVYWKHLLKRIDGSSSGREILDAMVTIQAWRRGCILMGRVGNWKCVGREQDVD